MNEKDTPKGVLKSPATATTSMVSDAADICRDQLTRIESILDNILRTLAPLVGAR